VICADYHYFQIIAGNKFADTAFIDKLNCRDIENFLKFNQTFCWMIMADNIRLQPDIVKTKFGYS
jgi:hypothetical protein